MRRGGLYSRSYRAAVMALNPAGYWRLGEASGTVAKDEMGRNDGTYVGSPTLGVAGALTGDPNTAVTLNGTQYASVPWAAALHPGDTFSLSVWFRRASATVGGDLLAGGASDFEMWLFPSGSGGDDSLRLSKMGVSTVFYTPANGAPTDTLWHNVAMVKAGPVFAAYLDGSPLPGTFSNDTIVGSGSAATTIGSGGYGGWQGSIQEPALWSRALSAAEIARLYAVGRGF